MELNANLQPLLAELAADPEGRGYVLMTVEQVVADLNNPRYVTLSERMISERTLFAVLGAERATAVLDALEVMPDRVMQRICRMLTDVSAGGVDISLAEARGMIDQFAAGGLLTAAEAAAIKALAENKTSRAQQIGYNEITAAMVERCREVM
jgi:hypothetical protein